MHIVYRYGNRSVVLSCLLDSQAPFAGSRIGGIRIIKYRFDDVVARISWVFVQLFTLDIGITLVFVAVYQLNSAISLYVPPEIVKRSEAGLASWVPSNVLPYG